MTVPLDLRYGARVDYRLRYGSDETCLECCRASFSLGVITMFSLNNNGPWQPIKTYGIHSYKYGKFEFVREQLEPSRLSSHTRFMWIQPRFSMRIAIGGPWIMSQSLQMPCPRGGKLLPQWQLTAAVQPRRRQRCTVLFCCNRFRRTSPGFSCVTTKSDAT